MIELFATERVKALVPKLHTFIERHLLPVELELLNQPFEEAELRLNDLRQQAKTAGLWAPFLPEKMGGLGLTLVEFAQLSEVMGATPFGHYVFNCQPPDVGNMERLMAHGSEDLQQHDLRPLVDGQIRSCFSMTEPRVARLQPRVAGHHGQARRRSLRC